MHPSAFPGGVQVNPSEKTPRILHWSGSGQGYPDAVTPMRLLRQHAVRLRLSAEL